MWVHKKGAELKQVSPSNGTCTKYAVRQLYWLRTDENETFCHHTECTIGSSGDGHLSDLKCKIYHESRLVKMKAWNPAALFPGLWRLGGKTFEFKNICTSLYNTLLLFSTTHRSDIQYIGLFRCSISRNCNFIISISDKIRRLYPITEYTFQKRPVCRYKTTADRPGRDVGGGGRTTKWFD
jgi:hypothetical protein